MNRTLVLTCSVAAMVVADPALAQDAAANAPAISDAPAPATPQLGDIVVTAQRRQQNLQTVGISVAQVDDQQIAALRVQQAADISRAVPGLQTTYATSDTTPVFAIRGIGLDDFNANNSSGVGVYVNDVFQSSPVFLNAPLYDIADVEVLKGPQGTLYGRNTTAGAVSITTRAPTETWDGYASLGFSRYDTIDAEAAVGGPVTEGLDFRISGTLTRQGFGYQTDIHTGRKFGLTRRGALRGQIKANIAPHVSLLVDTHYSSDTSTPQSPQSTNAEQVTDARFGILPGVLDYYGLPIQGKLNCNGRPDCANVGDISPFINIKGWGASAKLSVDWSFATLASITAYDHASWKGLDNYDGLPVSELDVDNNYRVSQWSQELRLISNKSSKAKWVVGALYSQDRFRSGEYGDLTYTVLAVDEFDIVNLITNYTQKTTSYGFYGNIEYPLVRRLSIVGGLRYSHDERSFDGITTDPSMLFAPSGQTAILSDSHETSNVSYRVGANFQATDKILVYTSYATGYKAGAYYGAAASTQATWGYVDPETVKTVELGVKSRFLDNRVQLNTAIFHTDYRNRQSSITAVGSASYYSTLVNIPKSRINGAEVDFKARPVLGLDLGASGTYLDTKIDSIVSSVRGAPLLEPITPGTRLPQAPKFSYSLSARYETPVGGPWRIAAGTAWTWAGKSYAFLSDPQADYGPIRNLSATLDLINTEKRWKLQAWARNLTSSANRTYAFTDFNGERTFYVEKPLTFGITGRFDY